MAVTHADLAPKRRGTHLDSKTGVVLMIISILFGLSCFILALLAEANRSQMSWLSGNHVENGDGCVYSGSGRTALLCGAGAFLSLAVGMMVEHTFMLAAISKSEPPPALLTWDPQSPSSKSLTYQAAFFFLTTWICFAVGEILLLAGISVESGHLKNWSSPKSSCMIIQQGVFSAAGVFGLASVFLASGLYITALRAERLMVYQENTRTEVLQTSALHGSPPRSPGHRLVTLADENPLTRYRENDRNLAEYLSAFDKYARVM